MTEQYRRDITVIGGSAGAIAPLRKLLAALPADYPAAVLIVVHVAPQAPEALAGILDRAGPLRAAIARDGAPIERGTIVVAPPDCHLIVEPDRVRLSRGPRENRHRPSIDVLFRSAAVVCGPRVIGVVLSGMLDDGAAGLWAIKRRGGVALVQDPAEAEFDDMPRNAMDMVSVDHSLRVEALVPKLVELAREPVFDDGSPPPQTMAQEVRMAAERNGTIDELDGLGQRVPYTCPECGGPLWEIDDGGPRYRCHVGHAYSLQTLGAEQEIRVEAALWAAVRKLEENERLARRLADDATRHGHPRSATQHEESARSSAAHADVLRGLLATPTTSAASVP